MTPLVDRSTKSNRSWSDYFELLLIQYICEEYNLYFPYDQDLSTIMEKLTSLDNGTQRIKLQNDNLKKIKPKVKEIIDIEILEKWELEVAIRVGRSLSTGTTSDIDVRHTSKSLTRFSVKSIWWSWNGTLKNIWRAKIKTCYGVDYDEKYNEMRGILKKHLRMETSSQEEIKRVCDNDLILGQRAEDNCRPYQKELNRLCCEGFNKNSIPQKLEILWFLSDAKDPDLYVIIVNEQQDEPIIYKPIIKFWEKEPSTISSEISWDTSFVIKIDDITLKKFEKP